MTDIERIVSEVLSLRDTELLVLRLPEGMATGDAVFRRFREELCRLIPVGSAVAVLAPGMELESVAQGKTPEQLFEAGPLRDAARAGWLSALGYSQRADVRASDARTGFEEHARVRVEASAEGR